MGSLENFLYRVLPRTIIAFCLQQLLKTVLHFSCTTSIVYVLAMLSTTFYMLTSLTFRNFLYVLQCLLSVHEASVIGRLKPRLTTSSQRYATISTSAREWESAQQTPTSSLRRGCSPARDHVAEDDCVVVYLCIITNDHVVMCVCWCVLQRTLDKRVASPTRKWPKNLPKPHKTIRFTF